MAGFDNETVYGSNVDFTGNATVNPTILTNGQLIIGSTALNVGGTHLNIGTITSTTLTIGYSTPNITIESGASIATTYTTNSGNAIPALGVLNVLGTGSTTTTGSGNTVTTQLTGLTNHAVLIGAGTATITKVGPVASTGAVLMSNGVSSDPGFSTATYPAIATGTGTLLRADGTNWVATTSTYPNTNAVSTLLYASAANVMSALATANGGVLTTDASGVPSIDTTNFAVLTTGVQMRGNNTNTAPPAGFIGQQIISNVTSPGTTLTSAVIANVTSIALTAGIWDINAIIAFAVGTSATLITGSIVTTTATNGVIGNNRAQLCAALTNLDHQTVSIPQFRVLLSGNTTYFLTADAIFAGGCTAYGRISAVRVG